PQTNFLTETSNNDVDPSSYAIADVGLPGSFNNGAGGITVSKLQFTTYPGDLFGVGTIAVPLNLTGSSSQALGYMAQVGALNIKLDSPVTSALTPIGTGEWLWAGTGNVTISGTLIPAVIIPTVQTVHFGPYAFSEQVTMPLAGTFSGDAS